MKTAQELQKERVAIVDRQVERLRMACSADAITEDDHDLIGHMMRSHVHHFLHLNDNAWSMFKEFIEETRQWRVDNKESLDAFEKQKGTTAA